MASRRLLLPGPLPRLGLKLDLGAADQVQAFLGRRDLGQTIAGVITKAIFLVYGGCLGASKQGLHLDQKRLLLLGALFPGPVALHGGIRRDRDAVQGYDSDADHPGVAAQEPQSK
jgi:hypothetical protein